MEGVIGGEYYNVPDVPCVMYFTNGGHALHGTYWHSNFGTPMSHGCVNLPMDVAAWMLRLGAHRHAGADRAVARRGHEVRGDVFGIDRRGFNIRR